MSLLGVCWVGVLGLAAATEPASTAPTPAKTTYLVTYRPGSAWLAGKPISEQPLKPHFLYLSSLYAKGLMTSGGPFTDDSGGAVVLSVGDATRARDLIQNDPAVKTGVFTYELHPWRLVPWEQHQQKM